MRGRLFLVIFIISQLSIFCYGESQEDEIFELLNEKKWDQAVELSNNLLEYVNNKNPAQESITDNEWEEFQQSYTNFVVVFALFTSYRNNAITSEYLCKKLDKLIGKDIRSWCVVNSNEPENVSYSLYSNEDKVFYIHIFDFDNKECILFTLPTSRRNAHIGFDSTPYYVGTISDYSIMNDAKNSKILIIDLNKIKVQ